MNSPEKRRDTKKLQNKRRRQKWHFLRDCCVAFVGRKMKCEDQGEVEGGRGHVENGMSKSKKQKRKCVRGKTNLWEMRQESVRLACCLMDWVVVVPVVGVGVGGPSFCRLVDRKKYYMDSSELVFLQKWGMKIKVKASLLFGGECPWQAGWCRQKQRWLGNKDGGAYGSEARGDVTAARKPDKDDGDKLRLQTAVFQAALFKEEPTQAVCMNARSCTRLQAGNVRGSVTIKFT